MKWKLKMWCPRHKEWTELYEDRTILCAACSTDLMDHSKPLHDHKGGYVSPTEYYGNQSPDVIGLNKMSWKKVVINWEYDVGDEVIEKVKNEDGVLECRWASK